ncbi:MAG: signal peptidase I [Fibrobacter sp.]|nr:signal peptidase I [Fibrobacter sp.]
MASLRHIVRKKLLRNSKAFIFFLVFVLVLFLAAALGLRFYALEPLKLNDSSMYPRFKESDIVWICKLPRCIDELKAEDIVWARMKNRETLVRKILAMPGEKVKFYNNGKVRVRNKTRQLQDDEVFIETRKIDVPKKGDTLYMSKLNDVEQDYAINIMIEQDIPFYIKTTLWQGERELPLDMLGALKLENRQVSLKEVDLLPWQDRYLLELQVFQREIGNTPVKIKREFYNKADSSLIEKVVAQDDYYFIISEKPKHSPDSRELGYFSKSQLLGKHVYSHRNIPGIVGNYINKFTTFLKDVLELSSAN